MYRIKLEHSGFGTIFESISLDMKELLRQFAEDKVVSDTETQQKLIDFLSGYENDNE